MRPSDFRRAVFRLEHVHLPSATTRAALALARRNPTESALIGDLASRESAPVALTVLSAMQSDSERVFDAVGDSIGRDPCLSWALVESLNQLPWYNGLRAFLNLPDDPLSSPSAYPFYILVRNKVFVTPDAAVRRYDYHVKALWHTLAVARDAKWCDPEDGVVHVVELIHTLLDKPQSDPFVVYFASLLLGRVAPLSVCIEALRTHPRKDSCPPVRAAAALTLRRLDSSRASNVRCYARSKRANSMYMMNVLSTLLPL
jgi:hypothetical protein